MNENRFINLIKKVIRLSFQSIDMIYFYIKSLSYKNNPKYKNMWLISERGNEAKDSAYVLFKYIRENHPDINIHYLMDKSFEEDYEKIKDLGNIIEYNSSEHKVAFLLCDKAISTHIGFLEPWSYKLYKLILDRKNKKKFVFLQHGITFNDVSNIYKKSASKIDLFITSTDREFKAINSSYGYSKGEVVQTGLARFDNLYNAKTKRQIVIMPTWRKDIVNPSYIKEKLLPDSVFTNSKYYKSYNSLINNNDLINKLNEYNYELVFYPHYEIQQYIKYFNTKSDNVIIAKKENYDVQSLLKESKLLITDYSSVAFDFAYMNKPILYYQFDELTHYNKGYFEYDKDGFGDIVKEEDELVQKIIEFIENDFYLDKKYQQRIDKCFKNRDDKNCERIFNEIVKI